jgi:hypothetical protein
VDFGFLGSAFAGIGVLPVGLKILTLVIFMFHYSREGFDLFWKASPLINVLPVLI